METNCITQILVDDNFIRSLDYWLCLICVRYSVRYVKINNNPLKKLKHRDSDE